MNKNIIEETSPYLKYFQTLFETFKLNLENKELKPDMPEDLDYTKESEELNKYINNILNDTFHKEN